MRKFQLFFSLVLLLAAAFCPPSYSSPIHRLEECSNIEMQPDKSIKGSFTNFLESDSNRLQIKSLIGNTSSINQSITTDTLSAFGLLTPANNSTLNIPLSGTGTIGITWGSSVSVSGNPVTYEWMVAPAGGNFNSPLITLPSNNSGSDTALSLTFAQLNSLMNATGALPGQTYSAIWTVKATSGTLSRFSSNIFNVNIFRINDTLTVFSLIAPANNASLNLTGSATQTVQFNWGRTRLPNTLPVTYTWLIIANNGSFANPITSILADNNGRDSVLTLTYGQITNLLSTNGITPGSVFQAKWTIRASAGTAARFASATYNLALSYNNVTATAERELDSQLLLYPNPAQSGEAQLSVNFDTATDIQIQITDLQGRVIYTQLEKGVSQETLTLPTSGLRTGLYLVDIRSGSQRTVKKLQLN